MEKIKIELEEAMRRADGMLVRQGYQVTSKWTNKYFDDGEKAPLWSMALVGLENTRVLLWEERDHWRATICVAVGKDGEFPICEGFIKRSQDKFMFPFDKMAKKIEETRNQVFRWNWSSASPYAHLALAKLALHFSKDGKHRKARAVIQAIINGELTAATVSEALSMVQSRYAKTRAERLESAMIWGEVYR